jgi:hypothetical protein
MAAIVTRRSPACLPEVCDKFFKSLICNELESALHFVAMQVEAIVRADSGWLMTVDAQTYPQFLGISAAGTSLRGLPTGGGKGRMTSC